MRDLISLAAASSLPVIEISMPPSTSFMTTVAPGVADGQFAIRASCFGSTGTAAAVAGLAA